MNTTYKTKQFGNFLKIIAIFLIFFIFIGQKSHAMGKRSVTNSEDYTEIFSISRTSRRAYLAYTTMSCVRVVRSLRLEASTILSTNKKNEDALFELGNYEYNCTNVVVQTETMALPRTSDGSYPLDQFVVTTKAFCRPRTYSDKILLAQLRACETDPSNSECFDAEFVKRLDRLPPTRVVYNEDPHNCHQ